MTSPATDAVAAPPEVIVLTTGDDVVRTRHLVRDLATSIGCDLVLQTKVVTAASELARNTVIHGGGGQVTVEVVHAAGPTSSRLGLAMTFVDEGPGIADLDQAMTGGWTSGGGLGLGLPGSKQLVHEFEISSVPGAGTRVRVVVWRRAR